MEKKTKKLFEEMSTLVESLKTDVNKFDNGNKSAGMRVRKGMMEIKKLAQQIRIAVSEEKAAL